MHASTEGQTSPEQAVDDVRHALADLHRAIKGNLAVLSSCTEVREATYMHVAGLAESIMHRLTIWMIDRELEKQQHH